MAIDYINTFWGNIFHSFSSQNEKDEIELLRRIPIFKDLKRKELKTISGILYERTYEQGEYMFETGQPGAAMFIIKAGELIINRKKSSGEEVELATLGDGEFVGELALLDNSPRSASAFVSQKTKALAIFRSDLDHLLEQHSQLGMHVMKKLAVIIGMRLKATNDLLLSLEEEVEHGKTG